MNEIEILAPAGSPDALRAACMGGADAVYLGLTELNARKGAQNFSPDALFETVRYCHDRGVDVHLTLNTVLFDRELAHALELVRTACDAGVDALIVQDLGLASLIRRHTNIPLHASTQMSIHSLSVLETLRDLGFSRAVLARECSREELAFMAAHSPIELEVFVHGALCMCVSGQCYLSAMLGGRSGNRGRCAQPCRLPFQVDGGTGYDLSLRDLSLIPYIDDLRKMGIRSVKIEGRLKRPEYVYEATRACRDAADGKLDAKAAEKLSHVFSRSGFTQGYYTGKTGREMFGVRWDEDVANTRQAVGGKAAQYDSPPLPVEITLSFTARAGEPSALTVSDGNLTATAQGPVPQLALKRALTEESVRAQLVKTGGTPFVVREAHLLLDEGLNLPASALNALRRYALAALYEKRHARFNRHFTNAGTDATIDKTVPAVGISRGGAPTLHCICEDGTLLGKLNGAQLSFFPADVLLGAALPENAVDTVGVRSGRALFGQSEEAFVRQFTQLYEKGVRHALVENLGFYPILRDLGFALHAGFGLNVTNGVALAALKELGFADATVSVELSCARTAALPRVLPVGMMVYGYLPLMLTRNCPAQNRDGACAVCKQDAFLTDRKNERLPIVCHKRYVEILNAHPLWLADKLASLPAADFLTLYFPRETPMQAQEILKAYREGGTPAGHFTRGLCFKNID